MTSTTLLFRTAVRLRGDDELATTAYAAVFNAPRFS
jgi:hypothetical protein